MSKFAQAFAGIAACAMMAGPTMAAGTSYAGSVSPYAVVGAFGSQASASVLCANTAAVAAGTAAAQAAPAPGCVLPVPDAAAPPVQTAAPAAPFSFGGFPLILALAGIAGLAALLLTHHDDKEAPPTPISPA